VLLPLAGAFIGWVTNAIAVRMLFRPYNPIKIPGFFYTFQGVIPKRRHELARSIGEVIEKELLPANELIAQFNLPELAEELAVYINAVIRQKVMEKLPGIIPVSLKNIITETLVDLVKKQLPLLSRFIAVSVNGECKEILLVISGKENNHNTLIEAEVLGEKCNSGFHISKNESEFIDRKITSALKIYFYEPDAAIIKSGLSSKLAFERSLCFINNSVDYLTGNDILPDFPGRIFNIIYGAAYNKKSLKEYIKKNTITSANIARRDFPDSPEKIKADLKLKDGGKDFFFFTKNSLDNFIFIHCTKTEK